MISRTRGQAMTRKEYVLHWIIARWYDLVELISGT